MRTLTHTQYEALRRFLGTRAVFTPSGLTRTERRLVELGILSPIAGDRQWITVTAVGLAAVREYESRWKIQRRAS